MGLFMMRWRLKERSDLHPHWLVGSDQVTSRCRKSNCGSHGGEALEEVGQPKVTRSSDERSSKGKSCWYELNEMIYHRRC